MTRHARVPRPSAPVPSPAPVRVAPLRAAAPVVARCACGAKSGEGECEGCRQARLQRSAAGGAAPAQAPPVVREVLGRPGRPLDSGARGEMERGFGHSFARVRVHDDARAAESARAVGAHAYAVGSDVVFGAGRYAPGTGEGRKLLAHELAHVVQQGGEAAAVQPRLEVGPTDAPAEREAEAAASAVAAGGRAAVAGGGGPTLRRFASREHQSLGDQATGTQMVNVGGDGPGEAFELTHGDVIMLSGDYFMPGDLFRLGKKPGNKGTLKDTRDEIVNAIKWITEEEKRKDPRFEPGGIWHGYTWSPTVREVVVARYQKLAAANQSHFVAPRGRDASGAPNPPKGSEGSAGTFYRRYHEKAISLGYELGRTAGASVSRAMAMEAAAQHFLTDAFSAGHVRTPIGDIREYWSGKYPLFFYNLLHKIALDTAIRLNQQHSNLTTAVGTVQMIYEGIIEKMTEMAAKLPPISLGDLLASVFHDFDNKHGLEIEGGGKLFGDSHLDAPDSDNITRDLAQAAILAGNADVKAAFDLGRASPGGDPLAAEEVREKVRAATGAAGGTYAPETFIARPDPSLPAQNWKAASFEQLWDRPLVGSSGPTFGKEITKSLRGGEINHQLMGLADKFEPVKKASGDLDPRTAYINGFVGPLTREPYRGIRDILHWAPDYGLRSVDRDDISVVTGRELDRKKRRDGTTDLHGMTLEARVRYVRQLIGGAVFDDEEALVERIFATAPAADRPKIYQRVEGHAWTGKWIEGVFTSDDEIYNALSGKRLDRVRDLINQGWSKPKPPAKSTSKPRGAKR
jgi:Domain of unknown function (DUF4157)